MQSELDKLNAVGVKVVGISYDTIDVLKAFADKEKISFPLLSDPESETIVAYAIKNPRTAGRKYGEIDLDGIPYPGTFLVDKDGVIRAKLFVEGHRARHSADELVEAAAILK